MTAPPDRHMGGDRCLCRACGLYFNSTGAFDKHRTGRFPLTFRTEKTNPASNTRRCRTEAEMRALKMEPNAKGFWIRRKYTQEAVTRRRGAEIS